MRTHLQIIEDAGGYQQLAQALDLPKARVRFWQLRQSIPLDQWRLMEGKGVATFDELFEAAEAAAKARSEQNSARGAAA